MIMYLCSGDVESRLSAYEGRRWCMHLLCRGRSEDVTENQLYL